MPALLGSLKRFTNVLSISFLMSLAGSGSFKITLRDKKTMEFYTFNCRDWFDPKRKIMKRELAATVAGKEVISSQSFPIIYFLNFE